MQIVTKRELNSYTNISQKKDLKSKIVTRNNGEHYLLIKGSIHPKDILIINIYVLNYRAPKYVNQTLAELKGEIDYFTRVVGDFNTPLSE